MPEITINGKTTVNMTADELRAIGYHFYTEKLSVEEVRELFPDIKIEDIEKIKDQCLPN